MYGDAVSFTLTHVRCGVRWLDLDTNDISGTIPSTISGMVSLA